MQLSEFTVRKAKPKGKPYRMSDGGGLHLLVQPTGSKLWQLRYRYAGKENILSLGPYPLITIAEARQKRHDAKKLLLNGIDPNSKKKQDRVDALAKQGETFGKLSDEYLERQQQKGTASSTITKTTWLLKKLAEPLADRPIQEITAAEVLALLQRIEQSGRRETALRLRGTISSVFKLAIVTLRAKEDPTVPLHGALLPPKVVGRAAITDEKELGTLLQAIDDYDGWPTIRAGLQFLVLTCVRPGEVRGAKRAEFDLKKAVWSIPAERMKMRQGHYVPLSTQALAILEDIWPMSEGAELVFPSVRSQHRPLSENAFNSALRRMGYRKNEVTAHGFRVTASSIMNARGKDPDVIEAVLAHQDRNAIRRTYNRATYWEQRVVLMQEWANLLDDLKHG